MSEHIVSFKLETEGYHLTNEEVVRNLRANVLEATALTFGDHSTPKFFTFSDVKSEDVKNFGLKQNGDSTWRPRQTSLILL